MAFAILGNPKPQFFDSSGAPLAGGTLTIVEPSTDVNKATYATYDEAERLENPNDNPITLDARGECDLWGLDGEDYKLTLKDANGDTVWTTDDVFLPGKVTAITAAESAAGVTPTKLWYEPGDVRRYGATGDGVTDDTTAINNAITAATPSATETFGATTGGHFVYVPVGVYAISSEIAVPAWVNVNGDGKGLSVFKAINAAAAIRFGTKSGAFSTAQRGGRSGDFSIDGDQLATGPLLHIGFVVERDFESIDVYDSLGDGLLIEAAQNCNFFGCGFQHNGQADGVGSNVVIDYGAGNMRFYGCEINRPGEYNIEFVQSGTSPSGAFTVPTDTRFYGCMIERWEDQDGDGTVTAAGTIYHGAGRLNRFTECDISATGLPSAFSMVIQRRDGAGASNTLHFHNCNFHGNATYSTVFDIAGNVTMYCTGTIFMENHTKVWVVDGTEARINIDKVIDSSGGTWFTSTGGAIEEQALRREYTDTYMQLIRDTTTNPVFRCYVDGDNYSTPRLNVRADGLLGWGNGTDASDVNLYRGAADRLQTDDQFYAVGGVRRGVTAGITADVGSVQGGGALTTDINEISTCANSGDAVTLPTAAPGLEITIINNGANACDVFPAVNDDLGGGVNVAASLAAGANITYVSYSAVTWVVKA